VPNVSYVSLNYSSTSSSYIASPANPAENKNILKLASP